MSIRTSVDLKLYPASAFETMVDELATALLRLGMHFEPGAGGRALQGNAEVGRVVRWQPPSGFSIEWHGADWEPAKVSSMELRIEPIEGGTRVSVENPAWGSVLGDDGQELAGWFASETAAPMFAAMAPQRFGDWFTDRKARRPTGRQSRDTYRDPLYHRPNFKVILAALDLQPHDYLVEVGCGGGAFLHDALKSGCRAAAIDHSPDMVKTARDANREAIEQKRLEIREGDAASLPFPSGAFTCAVMTGVFAFIADPLRTLSEIRRVLAPGGRLALFTCSDAMRGTPAAPEPVASRLHFYKELELEDLAQQAGFSSARVEQPDFEPIAREVGIPEEHLEAFRRSAGGQLLLARK